MLPLTLRLENKKVLVVGGGTVACRRINSFLSAKARVHVVSPRVSAPVRQLAERNAIVLHRREFRDQDLEYAWLVCAHTSSSRVNQQIAEASYKKQIWCLQGGNAQESDFWIMAKTQVGSELTLAVTANANPQRAKTALAELAEYARQQNL